jgi:hypothetical protein
MECRPYCAWWALVTLSSIKELYCGLSKISLVLLIGVNDKLIIIKHSKPPKCTKCGTDVFTYLTLTPEIKINTGNVVNVPIDIIKLPVNIVEYHESYQIYDVPRFGKLFCAYPSLKVLYLPVNNITGKDSDIMFWIDSKLARFFMTDKNEHIIVNECGEVFWPEVLTPLGDHLIKYETTTFTLEYDKKWKWEFTPKPALHTKPAIKN